jgi:hypothetical protein
MNKFKALYVFEDEDSFGGDYLEVRLLLNGEHITTFGDEYHDKGSEKVEAYVEGYTNAKDWKETKDWKWDGAEEIADSTYFD